MPYSPNVTDQRAQYLYSGITGAGQNIADMIKGIGDQHKELKSTQTLLKALAPQLGIDPDNVDKMSLAQGQGLLKSVAVKGTLADIGIKGAQADQIMTQIAARKKFTQMMAQNGNSGYTPGGTISPNGTAGGGSPGAPNVMQMALAAGMSPEEVMQLGHGLYFGNKADAVENPQEDLTPGSYKDPTTGAVFAYRGKQFLPAGYDPAQAAKTATPQPMHDPDGNLIGFSSVDVRGKSMFTPFKGGSKFAPATDSSSGQPIDGFYVSPEGKVVDSRTILQKQLGVAAPAVGPAATNAPAMSPGGAAALKPLTPNSAWQFLQQAGGDKNKARTLAQQAGYMLGSSQ